MSTTTTSTHAGTVGEMYAAFGRGDVPFVLSCLSDDVSWDEGLRATDIPWFQPRRGKQGVAEFFSVLAQGMELTVFEPQMILGDGNTVLSVIRVAGTVISTGKSFDEDLWVHRWIFDNAGKVATFRHIGDLARQEAAFRS